VVALAEERRSSVPAADREAFELIASATRELGEQQWGTLVISTTPSFAFGWLESRPKHFNALHAGIDGEYGEVVRSTARAGRPAATALDSQRGAKGLANLVQGTRRTAGAHLAWSFV
jgi:hypothetical protein